MSCSINDKFGHNYVNGICLDCGRSQKPIHTAKVEFKARKRESPNSMHQLVGDIVKEFGGSFPFLMMITKRVGEQQMREWASEARQAPPKFSKIALIMSSYKKFMSGIRWSKL